MLAERRGSFQINFRISCVTFGESPALQCLRLINSFPEDRDAFTYAPSEPVRLVLENKIH